MTDEQAEKLIKEISKLNSFLKDIENTMIENNDRLIYELKQHCSQHCSC